MSATSSAQVRT